MVVEKEKLKVRISNGKIVETDSKRGIQLEWDGVFYIYYGRIRNIEYDGKKYNCFPIMYIREDLSKVENIELFGCEGGRENSWEDGVLWEVPVNYEIWTNLKPFRDNMYSKEETN